MAKKLAVFISGYGSNLEVFLQNKQQFESLIVVSSKSEAFGVQRAQKHQAPVIILDKDIQWDLLNQQLKEQSVDMIFLAGFMRLIPADFLSQWEGGIFNLHPSLLPDYKGLKAIERAYHDRADIGVSVHHVVPEMDAGPVVLQEVAISQAEVATLSLNEVEQRVHKKEHELVLRWICQYC